MNLLAVSGSTSAKSSTAAILRAVPALAPPGSALVMFEGLAELPHFNAELDGEVVPAAVAAFRAQVAACDAVVICSPEYAHGIPGSLKNALDWLVAALEAVDKPVMLVCASPSGATFAHAHLLEVLRTMMGLHLVDAGAHRFSRAHLDDQGGLTSPTLVAALTTGLAQLARECAAACHSMERSLLNPTVR